jgi:hypothetical protein
MKYAVEMGSGAVIYIQSFIKIGSGIQKLIDGYTQHGDRISVLFFFFQNKESGLKLTLCLTYAMKAYDEVDV